MPSLVVSTAGLTKQYGDVTALDRVDLEVTRGSIYGLVGPNGAGKTTMLAILAGLRTATAGSTAVETASVGVLPDTPQFDRWLTGREVVSLSRSLAGDRVPASAVDDVLETTGLIDAADRRVKGYSRGMLQRLGLASVIVNEPDLLLLDEPAAALDPAGRREVLDLVLALRGKSTVLFSSHILDDVQEVCDDVGILTRGQIMYQGSLDRLLGRFVMDTFVVILRSGAADVEQALASEPWVKTVVVEGDEKVVVDVSDVATAERQLVQVLAASGCRVVSVTKGTTSLEDVFLEVTR